MAASAEKVQAAESAAVGTEFEGKILAGIAFAAEIGFAEASVVETEVGGKTPTGIAVAAENPEPFAGAGSAGTAALVSPQHCSEARTEAQAQAEFAAAAGKVEAAEAAVVGTEVGGKTPTGIAVAAENPEPFAGAGSA